MSAARLPGRRLFIAETPEPTPLTLPVSLTRSTELRVVAADTSLMVPSGLAWLDGKVGGLLPGDLLVLAGRTNVGKSHGALMMAKARAERGHTTVVVSLEDQAGRVAKRLQGGYAHERVLLTFPSGGSTELLDIVADAASAGATLVAIDYVQLTTWDGRAQPWSRTDELNLVLTAVRKACADAGMACMFLSQAGKPVDMRSINPFPSVYELADAPRVLASKADVVLMLGAEGKRVGVELTKAKDAETGSRIVLRRCPLTGTLTEPDHAQEDATFGRPKEDGEDDWN